MLIRTLALLALLFVGAAHGAVIGFPTATPTGDAGVPFFPDGAKAITPNNADTFNRCVTVYVGVAGNVAVTPCNSQANVTVTGLAAGSTIPFRVRAVLSTGTTASALVGIY